MLIRRLACAYKEACTFPPSLGIHKYCIPAYLVMLSCSKCVQVRTIGFPVLLHCRMTSPFAVEFEIGW